MPPGGLLLTDKSDRTDAITATSRSPPRRSVGHRRSAGDVVVALRGLRRVAGVAGRARREIPRVAVARRRLAGHTAQLFGPGSAAAAYGLVINGLPTGGPADHQHHGCGTGHRRQPGSSFALSRSPPCGRRSDGGATGRQGSRAVGMAASGNELAATVTVAECPARFPAGQGRSARRGPVLERLTNARRRSWRRSGLLCRNPAEDCSIACWDLGLSLLTADRRLPVPTLFPVVAEERVRPALDLDAAALAGNRLAWMSSGACSICPRCPRCSARGNVQ